MSQEIDLLRTFDHNLNQLFKGDCPLIIAVACSGGSDSVALVILLTQWVKQHDYKCIVYVLTVDHQLRSRSQQEAQAVQTLFKNLVIHHHILTWHHDGIDTKIQEQARQARYDLLLKFCHHHHIPWLLTGHHLNDQIETVTMRLLKRSQLRGLAGISAHTTINKINVGRPLLNISKASLKDYLIVQNVSWIEDRSNNTPIYQRNRLRQTNARLPLSWINALQRYRVIEEHWVKTFLSQNAYKSPLGYWQIDRLTCQQLPLNFLCLIINFIALELSCSDYQPRHKSIIRLCQAIKNTGFGTKTLNGYIYQLTFNKLLIYRSVNAIKELHTSYNGQSLIYDNRWQINYATKQPGLTVSKIGITGWQQLINFDPSLKKMNISKPIIMALPWFWSHDNLWNPTFLIKKIILRENSDQNVLRLMSSYHHSSFRYLECRGEIDNNKLNTRVNK